MFMLLPGRLERIAASLEITVDELTRQMNAELEVTKSDRVGYQNMTVVDRFEQLGNNHQARIAELEYLDTCLHPEW